MVQSLHDFLDENINYLKENGLYNEIDSIEGANGPEIKIEGKTYVNLSSNNYLGLATNEDLKEAAKAAIAAVMNKNDAILSDELNHASIIDGCRLSKAKIIRVNHSDMDDLRAKAKEAVESGQYNNCLLYTSPSPRD